MSGSPRQGAECKKLLPVVKTLSQNCLDFSESFFGQFSRKIRQMKADIFFNQLVVTKGLKIRRISIFIRMASLQRITSVRKVFQNPGSVARMMSNDTGRSEGKFTVYLSLLIKWHDISSLIWNFRCCPWSWWSFRKERKAQEDQFFRQQQQEQLKKLKNAHNDEIKAHESEIKRHQEAIQRHKEKIGELSKWRSFLVYRPWTA